VEIGDLLQLRLQRLQPAPADDEAATVQT
jgi:hypothetical protein